MDGHIVNADYSKTGLLKWYKNKRACNYLPIIEGQMDSSRTEEQEYLSIEPENKNMQLNYIFECGR